MNPALHGLHAETKGGMNPALPDKQGQNLRLYEERKGGVNPHRNTGKKRKIKETIVCRCEEITEKEILQTIKQGYHSLEELKRILRCGMGHCQGRTCLKVIAQMISRETGIPTQKIKLPTSRPPLKPIPLGVLGEYQND